MLNKLKRNNARFMFFGRDYNCLQVLRKKVCRPNCANHAKRKILLVVGKVLMFFLVTRMEKALKNEMKKARLA
jgi:hypothetical protein